MPVYRIEKTRDYTVMSNHHLRNELLSLKAKGLMSLMLSLPTEWDYTTKGLACICKDGVDAIGSAVKELEHAGYVTRRRIRDHLGRLTDIEYTIHEEPVTDDKQPKNSMNSSDSPKRDFPVLDNPILEKPRQGDPILENPIQLNKDISSKESSSTHLSINPVANHGLAPSEPCIDAGDEYRKLVHRNIEYDILVKRHGNERMDEMVDIMLDILCANAKTITINKAQYTAETVKGRLLKVRADHVEYVFKCLDNNTTKVRNIRGYMLSALYNAPATINSYYSAEVNHDLYGNP